MVRWPGHIEAGSICNEVVAHLDWLPTILAAAGVPDVKEQLRREIARLRIENEILKKAAIYFARESL